VSGQLEEIYLQLWDKKYIILVNFLASRTPVNFQRYAKRKGSLVARLRALRLIEICRNIASSGQG